MDNENYYLRISKATDLKNPKDRALYRFLEMLPGICSWGSLLIAVLLSWRYPALIAIFIIGFSIMWTVRAFYFAFHLWSGYKNMRVNENRNWLGELEKLPKEKYSLNIDNWQEIYHLAIITIYKEPLEIIRDTINSLKNCDYPKNRMIVVLACEEKTRTKNEEIVSVINEEFEDIFFRLVISWHPSDLPNEIAGKGSNETWAVKEVKKELIDRLGLPYDQVTVSPFDADTVIYPKYFSCLTWHYLTCRKPTRTSFQPIPLFNNNIWSAPAISRIFSFSSTFWQVMNQERPEKMITFSSHSMSLQALVEVGFKDPRVVADDSHIFWQCFLRFNGDYQVIPMFYPVSMDANVAENFFKTMVNIYKQQKRWAYGVGDVAYLIFGFIKNKKIGLKSKLSHAFEAIEGHWSWAVAPLLIFIFGWLPIVVGGEAFSQTMLSYSLPKMVSRISTMAMIGLVVSAYLSILLLPSRPPEYGRLKIVFFVFGWLLVPIIMIIFSSFPALDAQTHWLTGRYMGFWSTDKLRTK